MCYAIRWWRGQAHIQRITSSKSVGNRDVQNGCKYYIPTKKIASPPNGNDCCCGSSTKLCEEVLAEVNIHTYTQRVWTHDTRAPSATCGVYIAFDYTKGTWVLIVCAHQSRPRTAACCLKYLKGVFFYFGLKRRIINENNYVFFVLGSYTVAEL